MVKGFCVPLHVHHDEDETFYMLEGAARFQVEDKILTPFPTRPFTYRAASATRSV